MYPILLIIGCGISLTLVVSRLTSRGTEALTTDPAILFSVYYFIIHFLTPLIKYNAEWYRYQYDYSSYSQISSGVINLSIFLFAVFSSDIFSFQTRRRRLKQPNMKKIPCLKISSLIIFTFGIFFAWRDLQAISGAVGGVSEFLRDRHLASEARSAARIFANFMIISSALYLAVCLRSPRQNWWINSATLGGMYLLSLYYFSAISSRNSILLMIIFNLAIYSYYRPYKIKLTGRSLSKLILFMSVGMVGLYSLYFTTISRYSAGESAYLQERLDNVVFFMLDGAFGNDEALIWLTENEYDYQFGVTYVAAATNIIPRAVWSGKPLGGGPRLINMVRPNSYIIGQAGNNSLTTGLLTEARMNFGIVGMFVSVMVWAWAANSLALLAAKSRNLPMQVLFVILSISTSTMLLYSEFLGYSVKIVVYVFPLLLISTINPVFVRKKVVAR